MKQKVCILDYGSGNVKSVFNIFSTLCRDVIISNQVCDIIAATHIVLPGVGAFEVAMEKIKHKIPLDVLQQEVFQHKKPFLGICVGMQVLADKGQEFGEHDGLGWIPGIVRKLESGKLPLPHVGWNDVGIIRPNPLFNGLDKNCDFYFVHSYVFQEKDEANIIAKTDYEEKFNSAVFKDNIYGVQFHPEKSQVSGRLLLKNFLNL